MKKVFFVIAMFFSIGAVAQTGTWPINATNGSPSTAVETKGVHFVKYGWGLEYNYADTFALNLSGLQVFPFAVALAKDTLRVRNATATRWDAFLFGTLPTSGWALTGNSGTSFVTNFIGTTDTARLIFKQNRIKSGIIDSLKTTTGFGYKSLLLNTLGIRNVAFGHEALSASVFGSTNTAVGYRALASFTGSDNTALGVRTLESSVSGNHNTAVGEDVLRAMVTGTYNTGLGEDALFSTNGGDHNTGIGADALLGNTTGFSNTAVGWKSLYGNTIGNRNSSLGDSAFLSLTTGSQNTGVGHYTGIGITTGSNNTVIGANVTGLSAALNNNVIVADGSGFVKMRIDSGGYKNAFGYKSLLNFTGAIDSLGNTGVGFSSLWQLKSGTGNIGVGSYAGRFAYGSGNIIMGYQSGGNASGADSCESCTIIGNGSKTDGTKRSNIIVIGNGIQPDRDNAVWLGSSRFVYDFNIDSLSLAHGTSSFAGIHLSDIADGYISSWNAKYGLSFATTTGFINYEYQGIALNNKDMAFIGTGGLHLMDLSFYGGFTINSPGAAGQFLKFNGDTHDTLFYVNSTTDKVQIKDGTEGEGKVAVSDANGVFSWVTTYLDGSGALDFANTTAQNSTDLTVTVTGAADGDVVSLGVPNASVNANTCYTAWVSAANTVTIRFNNYSSGAVNPASGTFKVRVHK